MSSLYFFTGENGFLLREERRRWKEEFCKKHGQENLLVLDGYKTSLRSLLDEVGSAPFGAEKRLVILEGTPKFTKEDVALLLSAQHPSCLLIVVDPAPDKRTAGAKALLAAATVKEFSSPTGKLLTDWLRAYATENGVTLTPEAVDRLLLVVGEDQDMLSREVQKLALRGSAAPVTVEDIDRYAVPAGEREVWALTALITKGKGAEAVSYVRASLLRGGDAFSVWSMTLWMLRSVVSVYAVTKTGERSPAKVAQISGVPFPTARTLVDAVSVVDASALSSLVSWATDTDIALKTGGYRASGEAVDELLSILDTFIVRFSLLFRG